MTLVPVSEFPGELTYQMLSPCTMAAKHKFQNRVDVKQVVHTWRLSWTSQAVRLDTRAKSTFIFAASSLPALAEAPGKC